MVSALCGCSIVLAVNRANDTARTKMIPGNDCEDKLALLDFGMLDFYTRQDFGWFL